MVPAQRPDASINAAASQPLASSNRLLDASSMPVTTDTSPSSNVATNNNTNVNIVVNSGVCDGGSGNNSNKLQEVESASSKLNADGSAPHEHRLPSSSQGNATISCTPNPAALPSDALNNKVDSAVRAVTPSEHRQRQQQELAQVPGVAPGANNGHAQGEGDAVVEEQDNDIASDIQERSLGENDDRGSFQDQDDGDVFQGLVDDQMDLAESAAAAAVAAAALQQQQQQQQHQSQRQQQPSGPLTGHGEGVEESGSQDDPGEDGYPRESYTSPHHEWARVLQRRLNKGLTDAQLLARSNSMLASPSILAQSLTKIMPHLHPKDGQPGNSPQERPHQTAEELFDRPAPLDPSPAHYHETARRDEAFPSTLDSLGPANSLLLFAPLDPDQLYGKTPTAPAATPAQKVQPTPKPASDPTAVASIVAAVAKPAVHISADTTLTGLAPAPPVPVATAVSANDVTLAPSVAINQPTASAPSLHNSNTPTTNPVVQDTPGDTLPVTSVIPVPAVQVTPTDPAATSTLPVASAANVLNPPVSLVLSQSPEPFGRSPVITQTMAASTTTTKTGTIGTTAALPPLSGATSTAKAPVTTGVPLLNYPTSHLSYTPQTQYKANPSKKTREASGSERKPMTGLDDELSGASGRISAEGRRPSTRDDFALAPDSAGTGLFTSTMTRPRAGSESQVNSQDNNAKDWALQALSGLDDLNVDVSLSVGQTAPPVLSQSPAPQVAKVIQSPFEIDSNDTERPSIVLRANSYPVERSMSARRQAQQQAPSQTLPGPLPPPENVGRERTPVDSAGASPMISRVPGLALGSVQVGSQAPPVLQPGVTPVAPPTQPAAPITTAAMPMALHQGQYYQGSALPHSAPYAHHAPLLQPIPISVSTSTAAQPLVSVPLVAPTTSPTVFAQGHRPEHRAAGSVSSLREVSHPPTGHGASTSVDRSSVDNHPAARRQEHAGMSQTAPATSSAGANSSGGGSFAVPWLPQSQPLLPPKLDVNMIDVPALAGKQLLPLDPRPLPPLPESQKCFQFGHIAKAIRFWGRARHSATAFAMMDGKGVTWGSWTWGHVLGRAEMIAKNILEQTQLKPGARVILIYRLSEVLEFVVALYGAFLAGVVPVLVNQTQEYSEINYVFAATRTELVLTTEQSHKILHQGTGSKRGPSWPRSVVWWKTDGMGTWSPKDKKDKRPSIRAHELALIEYTKSASGELKGVATSHRSLLSQCRTLLQSFAFRVPATPAAPDDTQRSRTPTGNSHESLPISPVSPVDNVTGAHSSSSRTPVAPETLDQCVVVSWLESRQQVGMWLTSIMGAFCGNFTVFMDSSIASHPNIFVNALGALKANIAFGDYQGMRTLLGNLRVNPQVVLGGNPPDLSRLRTFYAHAQTCHPKLHIEFLEELLGPLGMCNNSFKGSSSKETTVEDKHVTDGTDDNRVTTPIPPTASSEEMVLPRGVIAFISLPEHGGAVIGLRDEIGIPKGIEAFDLRKRCRQSSFPLARSSLNTGNGSQAVSVGTASTNALVEPALVKLKSSSTSSMTQCVYLLHRGALRVNRIVVLATGQDALRRSDEPGTMLVGAVGYPIAKSTILIVDPETMALALPDEIGEVWFSSSGMPAGYWNLSEHTKEVFHAEALIVNEETMVPEVYKAPGCDKMLRTGLLGTLIEGRLVVFGTYDERLKQDAGDPMKPRGLEFEYHHSSDIVYTLRSRVRNVGELCVFSCYVNKEYLPVVCTEIAKDPSCTNPTARAKAIAHTVVDVLTDINGLRTYCVAVWEPNELPRVLSNGRRILDQALTKRMFELGRIPHLLHLSTYTEGVVLNLPHGDDPVAGVWGRDCIAKRQKRMGVPAQHLQFASNVVIEEPMDERMNMALNKFHNITDILMWRTIVQPEDPAYIEVDHRGRDHKVVSFKKLNHKVTGVATYLEKKHQLKAGDHVILWFASLMDLVVTLQACWVMGVIAIPLPAPGLWASTLVIQAQTASVTNLVNLTTTTHAMSASTHPVGNAIDEERTAMLQAMLHILDEVKIKAIIGNGHSEDLFKGKAFAHQLRSLRPQSSTSPISSSGDIALPPFVNISKAGKTNKTLGLISGFIPRKEWLGSSHPAMILYDLHARPESSSAKRLLKLTHEGMTALARNHKLQSNLVSGEPILSCLGAFSGPGFVQACLAGVYNGSPTLLIHPGDFMAMPTIWMEVVARHAVQNASLTYPMAEHLLSRLDSASNLNSIFSLESLKNLMVWFDGRSMRDLNASISSRLAAFKLASSALSMTYGTPLDIMSASRAGTGTGPVRLHVSSRLLRHGIIQTTSEGDDPTGIWLEDSGSVGACHTIAIVHPETFEICPINQVGEIWICADSTVNQFYGHTVQSAINSGNYTHLPFNACANYDQRVRYVRTGDLGFLWNSQLYHLQQQQQQSQGGGVTGHHHHHLQQLFVLGSMASSFQVNSLLHFASDIEATVESAHANVAAQGCVTFKTNMGQVVVVVKVQHQEMERLLPMYIPLMHAILEQHQFVPDVIVLVGEDVSTARGALDGCKPRMHLQSLYQANKLPILHLHSCHGKQLSHHQLQQASMLEMEMKQKQQQYQDTHVYSDHPSHPSHPSMQSAVGGDEATHFGHHGHEGVAIQPPSISQTTVTGGLVTASPHLTSAVLLPPTTVHHYPTQPNGHPVLAAAAALTGNVPPTMIYTAAGRPTSLILPSTFPIVSSGPSSAGAIPMSAAGGGHTHYPSAPGIGGSVHTLQYVHVPPAPHSHPRAISASGRAGSLEDFSRPSGGGNQFSFHQPHQHQQLYTNGGMGINNHNVTGDASSINSQKSGHGGYQDKDTQKKGVAVKNLVKGMTRLTEMRKASLT